MFNVKCHDDIISQKDLFVELSAFLSLNEMIKNALMISRDLIYFLFCEKIGLEDLKLVSPLATQGKLSLRNLSFPVQTKKIPFWAYSLCSMYFLSDWLKVTL